MWVFTQALLFRLRHTHARSEWCHMNDPWHACAGRLSQGRLPGSGTSCLFLEELSAAAKECRGSVPSGGFLPSPAVLHDSPRVVSSPNTNCFDRSEWKESLNWKNSWSLPGIFCSHLLPFSPFLLWPLGLLFLTSLCCFRPWARAEVALFAPLVPREVNPFLSGYKFCLLATELCGRIFIPECCLTNLIDPEQMGTCDPTDLWNPPYSALCHFLYPVFMDRGGPCTSVWADLSSTALSCFRI